MKKIAILLIIALTHFNIYSQVGIGTTSPDVSCILDIESSNKGLLIPRLTTAERNAITTPATGLLVFDTTSNSFQYNSGTPATPDWLELISPSTLVSGDSGNILTNGTDSGAYLPSTTYIGKFAIRSVGTQTITGLPFEPSSIKFSANASVNTYNVSAGSGSGANTNSAENFQGAMTGYATNYGSIDQQVISSGGSGNSINNISRYARSNRAIGVRYANQNGVSLGLTAAEITAFNSDGFTLEVSDHTEDLVVIYEAHR